MLVLVVHGWQVTGHTWIRLKVMEQKRTSPSFIPVSTMPLAVPWNPMWKVTAPLQGVNMWCSGSLSRAFMQPEPIGTRLS